VVRQAKRSEPSPSSWCNSDVEDGIATITINRPDALNALNEEVVKQLGDQLTAAAARKDVQAIVIAGAGKAFVAGADIRFFVQKIEQNAIADIVRFTRQATSCWLGSPRWTSRSSPSSTAWRSAAAPSCCWPATMWWRRRAPRSRFRRPASASTPGSAARSGCDSASVSAWPST
jgi:hypothetical protein